MATGESCAGSKLIFNSSQGRQDNACRSGRKYPVLKAEDEMGIFSNLGSINLLLFGETTSLKKFQGVRAD